MQDHHNDTAASGAPADDGPFLIGDHVLIDLAADDGDVVDQYMPVGVIDGEHRDPDGVWFYDIVTDHGRHENVCETILTLHNSALTALRSEQDRRRRAAYIAALHELADFLAEHPEVPVGRYDWENTLGPRNTAEVTGDQFIAIAEAMDAVIVETASGDRLVAMRKFGPITFEVGTQKSAVAIEERTVEATEYVLPDAITSRQRTSPTTSLRMAA